jgi:riboflavin kinase / FMN adenylyltransferase
MRIFRHFHQADGCPLALAIGNFDGMHLGHQALLSKLTAGAMARSLRSAVMTFEPHPREFFMPDNAPTRLTSLREKLELFAETGVEYAYTCHFNAGFATVTAEDFMQRILRESMNVKAVLVGEDFRFGAKRQGSHEDFAAAGFEIISLPDVLLDGHRVSSTAVRESLAQGNLVKAAQFLGRAYSISGKVVHGDKVGRTWGYPTANIHMLHDRPPLFGVYAVKLEGLAEAHLPGVASLGVRPTVKQNGRPTLEVHLFDFQQEIYGKHVRVHFMHKIRDEMKFSDIETLKTWIASDARQAREYFKLDT